ncbi:MAG: hypothetical protein M3315_10320 [Actinomycetota bacterium]|nr:hypothetical protein [Actinomycetota bacterium]
MGSGLADAIAVELALIIRPPIALALDIGVAEAEALAMGVAIAEEEDMELAEELAMEEELLIMLLCPIMLSSLCICAIAAGAKTSAATEANKAKRINLRMHFPPCQMWFFAYPWLYG